MVIIVFSIIPGFREGRLFSFFPSDTGCGIFQLDARREWGYQYSHRWNEAVIPSATFPFVFPGNVVPENEMAVESKLIPILREGVDLVKMILFRRLRLHLANAYPEQDASYVNRMAGAVINDLFGDSPPAEPFAGFARDHAEAIDREVRRIAVSMSDMLIPLTDALRIQFLCDYQEGVDSTPVLARANELGILLSDREVPLPARFISMVRKLGSSLQLVRKT
ncbi:hypothetical protein Sfum_0759 [Syntrophobacter fumaroxidans MPOB]|uniref:Uncharacterized protein n=1 Tax=Syntrophobacter fumaroxidans (strain DSM 10017 / MPOB) TaxID=335543 RepID=A0LGA5_SYNFM|nr:hypothetical protein Sfum_0759 [Syntrophobacter fumaroxidans MPOB]